LEVAAERGLTRFIGRMPELAALEELLFELHHRLAGQDVAWVDRWEVDGGSLVRVNSP
jgi:hypothetical protein